MPRDIFATFLILFDSSWKKNTNKTAQLCQEIVGLASNRAAKVHSDLGEHDGTFVAKGVPSHDSRMFMLSSSGHAAQKDVVFM